ncbi:hypothetical protein ABZY06_15040 [Streptomyces sp. NPDC006540]|uniref:hypothetical protein n=1 Tax=Streptomyces sp. NPDC006540 TaxID=3155353 RepID=UPI0033A47B0A
MDPLTGLAGVASFAAPALSCSEQQTAAEEELVVRGEKVGGRQKYSYLVPAGVNYRGLADIYAIGASGSAQYRAIGDTTRPFDRAYALPLRSDSTTYKTFL